MLVQLDACSVGSRSICRWAEKTGQPAARPARARDRLAIARRSPRRRQANRLIEPLQLVRRQHRARQSLRGMRKPSLSITRAFAPWPRRARPARPCSFCMWTLFTMPASGRQRLAPQGASRHPPLARGGRASRRSPRCSAQWPPLSAESTQFVLTACGALQRCHKTERRTAVMVLVNGHSRRSRSTNSAKAGHRLPHVGEFCASTSYLSTAANVSMAKILLPSTRSPSLGSLLDLRFVLAGQIVT